MEHIMLAAQVIFHPVDFCALIKRKREKLGAAPIIVILLLTALCRLARVYFTHYPLNSSPPEKSNILLLLAILFVPVFSWVVGAYSTTTLMSGEVKFSELLTAGVYGYIPYIITTPVFIAVSHLLSGQSTTLFQILGVGVVIWMVIYQFICFMSLNDYGFLKSLWVGALSVVAVLLLWAVLLLFFVFIYQMVVFAGELIVEMRSRGL